MPHNPCFLKAASASKMVAQRHFDGVIIRRFPDRIDHQGALRAPLVDARQTFPVWNPGVDGRRVREQLAELPMST